MQDWMQIAAGAGAAVVAMLLVTGLILAIKSCLSKRQAKKKKKNLYAKTEVHLSPPWQKGSAASLVPTYLNAPSSDPLYRWHSQDLPHPYQDLVTSSLGSVESLCSSSELDERRRPTCRELLSPDLKEIPAEVEDESDSHPSKSSLPRIDFQLVYENSTSTLRVRVAKVTNLPFKYRKRCSSFVKVSLLARRKSSVHTNIIRKSLNPEYEEWFAFTGYSLTEMHQYTLRFTVYVKMFGYLKNKFVGDLYYPISKTPLQNDTLIACSESIRTSSSSKRSKLVKSSSDLDLGQLLVVLQYQYSASRMKVLIRKAEKLPKGGHRLFKQSDHYVILNLVRGHEVKTSHETRAVSGPNPVWNQPFLFDIPPESEGDHFWLQFVIMRGRMYSHDGIVGHVAVGPETTSAGSEHWHDVMNVRSPEIAKWHSIVPL